jgi:hypothetical protein
MFILLLCDCLGKPRQKQARTAGDFDVRLLDGDEYISASEQEEKKRSVRKNDV